MKARTVLVPLLVLAAAAVVWWQVPPPGYRGVPAAVWRVGDGTAMRKARNYDELPPETAIRLAYGCDEPRHVYVFAHSQTDGTLLLFPSPDLRSSLGNPLPAGKSVLPGRWNGAELAWSSRAQIQPLTTLIAVAAREPVAELEQLLPQLRRYSNSVLTDGSIQITNPTGGEPAGRPRQPLPSPLLQRAADRSATEVVVNGPMAPDPMLPGVWTGSLRIKERQPQAK